MEALDLQQRALTASQSRLSTEVAKKRDPSNKPAAAPQSREPILVGDSDDEIEVLSSRAAKMSTGAGSQGTKGPGGQGSGPPQRNIVRPLMSGPLLSALRPRVLHASRPLQPAPNQGNVIVKRPSPAPSAASVTSSTADYTFFEPVKPKVALPPARPVVVRPGPVPPFTAPLQPSANAARPPGYALQGVSNGLIPLGGPAAEYARAQSAVMGENDMLKHIRPAKGFASPARASAFGVGPYNIGNGVRAGAVAGVPPRPVYDAQGRPIQPRGLAPTVGPNGYPLIPGAAPAPALAAANDDGEDFSAGLRALQPSADDYAISADPDADMRELLSGAIGTGEEPIEDGDGIVEGFAAGIKLMPHQIRGTAWIAQREAGRKYGGILADDMGLGKTIQMTAQIVKKMPTAKDKKDGFKAGTLVICPLAVMEQWKDELIKKTKPGMLKVTTHHSSSRTKSAKVLEGFDVVVTTFQTLSSEHAAYLGSQRSKTKDKNGENSDSDGSDSTGERFGKSVAKGKRGAPKSTMAALFQTKWFRIIADEAQGIKNRGTKTAKAAFALQGKFRWCLTGTPIQNNVDELFSLFHFLRAKPLDSWTTFSEKISKPVKKGQTKMAMKRLHVLLKAIMLRRRKDATIDGKPILNLPGRQVDVVECEFDAEERSFYDALQAKTEITVNKFVKSGTFSANAFCALIMLLRLRQACSHPSLCIKDAKEDKDAIESDKAAAKAAAAAKAGAEEEEETDELADLLGGLAVKSENKGEVKKCTMCFTPISDTTETVCSDCAPLERRARATSVESGLPPSSAKIRKLTSLLQDIDRKSEQKEKTIVFSQFTSFLDLAEPFLKAKGIKFVRYDGKMRNDKRQASLAAIKDDPSIRVILISFKCGSTGLNLTCCNHVILMDLWWNPALEDQAFDRAHRLGQKLDVSIYKLTIRDTVEDRILNLQETKRELATAALSGGAVRDMKMTMADMMDLFRANPKQDHH